jgi:hypothetical protein
MADDDRVGGWRLMYQLMQAGEWLITDNCKELIMCLPALTRHETKVEDLCKVDGEDAADAARYGLKSHLRGHVGTPPLGVRVTEAVAAAEKMYPDMAPPDFYMIAEAAESKLRRPQNFRRGSRFAWIIRH